MTAERAAAPADPAAAPAAAPAGAVGIAAADATPPFSVVIPTRDRPDALRRAVDSALRQDAPVLEVVVVDEASTPPAREGLGELAADPRVVVLRHEAPVGAAAARNAAHAGVRGSWIAYLDDDDTFAPGKLARVSREIEALGDAVDVVYHDLVIELTQQRYAYRNAPDPGPITLERLLVKNLLGGPSMVVVRARCVFEVGGFPDLPGSEDHGLYLELAAAGARFHHLPEVLGSYERTSRVPSAPGAGARTMSLERADAAYARIGERFASELAAWPASRRRERHRHFLTFRAYRQLVGGDGDGAARDFVRAFREQPGARSALLLAAAAAARVSPSMTLTLQGWVKQRWRGADRAAR